MGERLRNTMYFKKVLAWVLVLSLTITFVQWPQTVRANEESQSQETNKAEVLDETEDGTREIVGELEEQRTESAKQFLMKDGTVVVVQYETDVHYQNEEGQWQPIDNSLSDENANEYTNKNGRVKFKFAKNPNANFLVRIMQGDYHIFFSAQNTQKGAEGARIIESEEINASIEDSFAKAVEAENVKSGIIYENIFAGADVEYLTSGSSLKENIIVKEKQDVYEYTFEIKTNKIEIRQEEDGSISFLTEDTQEVLYQIPKMYMWDASGKESDAVEYELTTKNKKNTFTVRADASWINAQERVFPVTIDPTLQASSTSTGDESRIVRNQYVTSGNKTLSSAGYGRGFLGYDTSGDKIYRLFVQFKKLPVIPDTSVILNAKFYYAQEDYDHVAMSKLIVAAKAVTEDWTWGSKINWNTQPAFSSTILDYQTLSSSTVGTYVGWNITKLIKAHYEDKDNTSNATSSFVLTGIAEGDYTSTHAAKVSVVQENSAGFFSNAQPVLVIAYRDTRGLESYYTYQTQDLGLAGTAYIGDYTKELTIVENDFSTNSTVMPFSIYHVYNSSFGDKHFRASSGLNTKNYTKMKAGLGWKLNIQESVIEKTISGTKYLIYNDSDGTDHYFPLDSGSTYKDEDGLKLTIKKATSPTRYTMMDEQGNQKIFHNGFLSTIKDANGNAIYILYNGVEYSSGGAWYADTGSTNRVTKIVQINKGQSTPIVLATFGYEDTTYIQEITDYAGRTYYYDYIASKDVNGEIMGYNLYKIRRPDGSQVIYNYYQIYTNGVSKLRNTYDSDTELGGIFTYKVTKHSSKLSSFRDIRWTSDDAYQLGQTVYITNTQPQQAYYRNIGLDCTSATADDIYTYMTFDSAGRTISQVSMDYDRKKYYGAASASYNSSDSTTMGNKLLTHVVTGMAGINLLKNGGGEDVTNSVSDHWTSKVKVSADTEDEITVAYDNVGSEHSGKTSFRMVVGEGAKPNSSGDLSVIFSNKASLEAGVTYTFSGYFKNTKSANFNDKSKAYLTVSNSSGTKIATSSVISRYTTSGIEKGWARLSMTFTPTASGTYTFAGCAEWIYGTSNFDDFQLEKGKAATTYNYYNNGDVEWTDDWSYTTGASRVSTTALHGNYAIKITGDPEEKRYASITVPLHYATTSDRMLVLSGWAKANSVAGVTKTNASKRAFGLEAILTYSNGSTETHYASFDETSSHLQYLSMNIIPKNPTYSLWRVTVRCVYGKNANTAYFDNISLRKEPVATYKYDDEGNVVGVDTISTDEVNFSYSAGNLIQTVSEGEGTYDYTYDSKHNLTKVTNDGVEMSLTYDSIGHVKSSTVKSTTESTGKTITTSATYSANGEHLLSQTDALGQTTTYTVNARGITDAVTDAKGNTISYEYNEQNDRLERTSTEDGTSVNYTYADGMLASIIRKSLLPEGEAEEGQTYRFTYDVYGNVTKTMLGDKTLASYTYMAYNGPLTKITYGNGYVIEYGHDVFGRVISEKRGGVLKYRYIYCGEGNLSRQEELDAQGNVVKAVCYEYDSLDRLIRSWEEVLNGNALVRGNATEHLYDTSNRLTTQSYQTESGTSATESYTYNSEDGTLANFKTTSGKTLSYTYDYLKRLSGRSDAARSLSYTYQDVGDTKTSYQVSGLSWTGLDENLAYNYEYDDVGNITKITQNGITLAEYTYDNQYQLLTESLPQRNLTYAYTYDGGGNIQNVTVTENGVETVRNYSYTDTDWKDLMTSYNGQSLTYDAIGNPLTYYNGTNWNFTWNEGRRLDSAQSGDMLLTYSYDSSGMRSSKTSGNEVHNYTYLGDMLVEETWGSNKLEFAYDETGRPYSVKYNGTIYYYVLNLQGDVVRLVDEDGVTCAEYLYNAWGKLLEVTGDTIGTINPLRYRGYYYDTETGFYYVSSRYYDPEIGRFLNADGEISSIGGDILGYNMFAYCMNNPVNMSDPTGNWPKWATKLAVAVAVVAVVAVVATVTVATAGAGTAIAAVAVGAAKGAAIGLAVGAATGAASGAISHRVSTGSWKGAGEAALNGMGNGALTGAIGGAITGGIKGGMNYTPKTTTSPVSSCTGNKLNIKYPGNDPTKCEIPNFEWRGSGTPSSGHGNFVNMKTGEWLHPDLNHGPPIGPHWDYGVRGSSQTFRIFPDGNILPK